MRLPFLPTLGGRPQHTRTRTYLYIGGSAGEVSGDAHWAGRASGYVLGRCASLAWGVPTDISQVAEGRQSVPRWVSIGALTDILQLSSQAARSLARLGVQRPPSFACLPFQARHGCHETAAMTA